MPETTCVRTFEYEFYAKEAVKYLADHRITATYEYSDFVEKWCVKVPQPDARAAYHRLTYCWVG